MSAAQHTPGPWAATGHDGKRNIIVESREHGSIASVWDTGALDIQQANARLIAAAPELLEALKEATLALKVAIAHVYEHGTTKDFLAEMEFAGIKDKIGTRNDAAIAKAEGGAS